MKRWLDRLWGHPPANNDGDSPQTQGALASAVEAVLAAVETGNAAIVLPSVIADYDRRLLEACLARREQFDEPLREYLRQWGAAGNMAESGFAGGKLWEWLGDAEEAERHYRAAIASQPGHAKSNNQIGLLLLAKEQWDEAIICFGRAVEADSENAVFRNNLGIALWHVGELDDALDCFRQAWRLDSGNSEIRRNLFRAAMEVDDLAVAGEVVDAALASSHETDVSDAVASVDKLGVKADDPVWPHAAQAALVLQGGELDRAETLYRELMRQDEAAGLTGLGMIALSRGQFDEAITQLQQALDKIPENPAALYNLAMARSARGDLGAALEGVDRALRYAPEDPRFLFMRSLICLQTGRWKEGWRDYESRLRFSDHIASSVGFDSAALWQGENLSGKTLAIVGEQGAGDQIQFVRFATEAAKRGAEVVVYCNQAPLKRLMAGVPGVAKVCAPGEPFVSYDHWVAMLSLPRLLGIEGETLAPRIPYVFPEADAVRHWRQRLADAAGKRVGVVWGGNPAYGKKGGGTDRRRSLPLSALAPLWDVPGVSFFSLQKGPPREQLADFSATHPIVDYSEEWADFADTAAFISALDLVISVDTSVAHLAGALGRPVWILSRHDACWRWLENREDSPWYPSARVFRLGPGEGWGTLVRRLTDALGASVCRNIETKSDAVEIS